MTKKKKKEGVKYNSGVNVVVGIFARYRTSNIWLEDKIRVESEGRGGQVTDDAFLSKKRDGGKVVQDLVQHPFVSPAGVKNIVPLIAIAVVILRHGYEIVNVPQMRKKSFIFNLHNFRTRLRS